jgi:hypothetical protein
MVCFIDCLGPESRKITFVKSASLLGYADQELIGSDFSRIIPIHYNKLHDNDGIFSKIFCHNSKNKIFSTVSPILVQNKYAYLVPVVAKLRL